MTKQREKWYKNPTFYTIMFILSILGIIFIFGAEPRGYAIPYPRIEIYPSLNLDGCVVVENITQFPEEDEFEVRTIRKGIDGAVPIDFKCDEKNCVLVDGWDFEEGICKVYDYNQVLSVFESFEEV